MTPTLRQSSFTKAALPVFLLGACSITPEDCLKTHLPHEFWGAVPSDIGGGLVATYSGATIIHDGIGGSNTVIDMIDCATKEKISFDLRSTSVFNGVETVRNTPEEDANSAEFQAFFESDMITTKAEIIAKANSLGIRTSVAPLDREHCGCAAFYPELLGDQEPAEERDA